MNDLSSNLKKRVGEGEVSSNSLSDGERLSLWEQIEASIDTLPSRGRSSRIKLRVVAAAACLAILFASGYLLSEIIDGGSREDGWLVFETGNNQRTQLTLSDSTVIWLNGNSRVEYPGRFTGKERRIRLEGEAYFAVHRDSLRPFVVVTPEMNVWVLGTRFNVRAFREEEKVLTTLVDGKVVLQLAEDRQRTVLLPGQQASCDTGSGEVTVTSVDTRLITGWMEGHYIFENETFEEIAKQFEKMYGVKIGFEGNFIRSLNFTGTFFYEQSLEDVLSLLKQLKNFNYTIKDNDVTIY